MPITPEQKRENERLTGAMRMQLISIDNVGRIALIVLETARDLHIYDDDLKYGVSDELVRRLVRRLRELLVLEDVYKDDPDGEEAMRLVKEEWEKERARWEGEHNVPVS